MVQENSSNKEASPKMMTEREAMDRVSAIAKRLSQEANPKAEASSQESIRQTIPLQAVIKNFLKPED